MPHQQPSILCGNGVPEDLGDLHKAPQATPSAWPGLACQRFRGSRLLLWVGRLIVWDERLLAQSGALHFFVFGKVKDTAPQNEGFEEGTLIHSEADLLDRRGCANLV